MRSVHPLSHGIIIKRHQRKMREQYLDLSVFFNLGK